MLRWTGLTILKLPLTTQTTAPVQHALQKRTRQIVCMNSPIRILLQVIIHTWLGDTDLNDNIFFCTTNQGEVSLVSWIAEKRLMFWHSSWDFRHLRKGSDCLPSIFQRVWELARRWVEGSMGLAYLPTFAIKNQPKVSKYAIFMDPIGISYWLVGGNPMWFRER